MSKEADVKMFKFQTCVLKVNVHCDGCKQKVKKLLQKIDGVYTFTIDSEQGKVIVTGNVHPYTLIKKLQKKGKYAELWGVPKGGVGHSNPPNKQFHGMHFEYDKGQKDGNLRKGDKDQKLHQQLQQQLKLQQIQQQQQLRQMQQRQEQQQQLQQIQLMKGMKDLNMNSKKEQKTVKFSLPEYVEDESDDSNDFHDGVYFDDDNELDSDFEVDHEELMKAHMKMKAMNGNKGNGVGNVKKGGGVANVQQNKGMGGNCSARKNDGFRKNEGGNQTQGRGGGAPNKKGACNGGKIKNAIQQAKGAVVGSGKNNGDLSGKQNNGFHDIDLTTGRGSDAWNRGAVAGQMKKMHFPAGQTRNIPPGPVPAQGLPAGGYFQTAGPQLDPGNPYHRQYLAAMMMRQQQHQNGSDRFQPLMYARPQSTVAYLPPPSPAKADPYTHFFSDENANSCIIM